MNNAKLILNNNGLGDKLLDLIGFFIICKYLNYNPHVNFFDNNSDVWGNYDIRLFDFKEVSTSNDENCSFYINSPTPSSSLCPYKVYEFIHQFLPEISFEQVSNDFISEAKKIIKPSSPILLNIPSNIENAYGIHLRKSDKVNHEVDIIYENTIDEFKIIMNKLLEDVKNIIIEEKEPVFLIVSEEENWKYEIIYMINQISIENKKEIKILEIDYKNEENYSNFNSVLDMFCLSRCKEIIQGVKYSNFSILASLIGNNKIRNYSNYTNSYDVCLIHSWSSSIEINNNKNFDITFHKNFTNNFIKIETNINNIFS
jgi:hypothetical protein